MRLINSLVIVSIVDIMLYIILFYVYYIKSTYLQLKLLAIIDIIFEFLKMSKITKILYVIQKLHVTRLHCHNEYTSTYTLILFNNLGPNLLLHVERR